MESYFLSSLYSDITFQVAEETVYAHRFAICGSSKVFEKMLDPNSQFIESTDTKITIADVDATTFKFMLHFMYFNKLPFPLHEYSGQHWEEKSMDIEDANPMAVSDAHQLIALLTVADRYDVKDLIRQCTNALCSMTSIEDHVATYICIHKVNRSMLYDKYRRVFEKMRGQCISKMKDCMSAFMIHPRYGAMKRALFDNAELAQQFMTQIVKYQGFCVTLRIVTPSCVRLAYEIPNCTSRDTISYLWKRGRLMYGAQSFSYVPKNMIFEAESTAHPEKIALQLDSTLGHDAKFVPGNDAMMIVATTRAAMRLSKKRKL